MFWWGVLLGLMLGGFLGMVVFALLFTIRWNP